jgi:transcriptional regulator with XRE-family HTH domain
MVRFDPSAQEAASVQSGEETGDSTETETFGQRVAAAIEMKGWTLAEAAREISRYLPAGQIFNPVNLSHYVHGRSFPRPRFRRALEQALDISEPFDFPRHRRKRSPGQEGNTESQTPGDGAVVRVQDMGDGTARVQIDQVVPWPDALKLLEILTHKDH